MKRKNLTSFSIRQLIIVISIHLHIALASHMCFDSENVEIETSKNYFYLDQGYNTR